MTPDKLIWLLQDDIRSGGDTFAGDIRDLSDADLLELANVLQHWRFQVTRETTRRAGEAK